MTKYKCGCESNGIIIATNSIVDFFTYKDWSNSVGVFGTKELCLYCYLEKNNIKYSGNCGYIKGKWVITTPSDKKYPHFVHFKEK